jgi:hypothetical protein
MSEEQQTEQKFGLEGIEQSQGYQPIVLQSDLNAQATAEQHEQELHAAVREFMENRPADDNPPPTERAFVGPDGKPTPENHTLSPEQAAKELAATRQSELDILEAAEKTAIAEAADQLRGDGFQQQPPQPEPVEQPQASGADTQPVEQQQPGSSRLERLLQEDPVALASVHAFAEQARQEAQQAAAQKQWAGDMAIVGATSIVNQNVDLVARALLMDIPELQGVTPDQVPLAIQMLAKSNPQRAQVIAEKSQGLQALALQAQNAKAAEQQVDQRRWAEWSLHQDNLFDRDIASTMPPERFKEVQAQAAKTLLNAGLSERELIHYWQTNPLLRSAAGQAVVMKAAMWDLALAAQAKAKTELPHKRAPAPVAQVQRPGISSAIGERDEGIRMPGQFASAREAADYLSERRRLRR